MNLFEEASKSYNDVKMQVYIRLLISVSDTWLLGTRHPALRRQELGQGHNRERGNLIMDVKGECWGATLAESTNAVIRDGYTRSSEEGFVMNLERRGVGCRTVFQTTLRRMI